MNTLVRFFIENNKLTIILSIIIFAFGLLGLSKLNSESYPAVNFATAVIETRYTGATAEDIETKVTKKLEDAIREVSGLKDVKSVSSSGLSSIVVRVDMDNEDEEKVLDDLQKAVEGVSDLPNDLREDPSYLEVDSAEFPAIEVAITGDNTDRARDLAVDLLKEELEDNKRVKNVRPVGFLKRQFNIRLDNKKLEKEYISVEEVTRAISLRNVDVPGGVISNSGIRSLIRVEGKIQNKEDLEQIVIRSNYSGKKISLRDVAQVEDGEEDAKFLTSYNGADATLLVVNKKAGADTLKLVVDVNETLERFKSQYPKLKIQIYNNEAEKVKKKLEILSSNAVTGLILVVVFLFLFLPGKVGVMASISLPLAVLVTIGMMPYFDMNLDAITILALVIALGMLVDNAVVISENFSRLRLSEAMEPKEAAIESVKQLWLPITTTGLTTIAAFIPMLVTKGIMGQFIMFIPIVVTISILASLAESFFLLPMRLSFTGKLKGEENKESSDWFQGIINKFESFMESCVRNRYIVALGFILTLVSSFGLMIFGNKFMLFPAEQTEIYTGRVEMQRGTDVETTLVELEALTDKIKQQMGDWQRDIVVRSGISSMGPTDPQGSSGENQGLITIYASDYAKYNVDYQTFLEKLNKVKSDKAKKVIFKEMVNGPPVGSPVNATFRSNNDQSLNSATSDLISFLKSIEGIKNVESNDVLGEKEIKVRVNHIKAGQLGLTVNSIGDTVRTALSGLMVSKVTLDNKEVDLNIRYLDQYRRGVKDLQNIKVMDNQGNLVPLSSVAQIEETQGQFQIKRFDFKRAKTITADLSGDKLTSQMANDKLKNYFLNTLSPKYKDVTLVFGGEAENTKESMESLGQALVLSLMGIFGLLVFLFRSYLRPFIIMTTIPLGLVGFSIAFYFHDRAISFMAMIGVIGLGGIIVNSGIVLISFIDQMRSESQMALTDILSKASAMRLRAVFVTSLTTISGLIPTAYGIGGSDSMLVPMTLAMAWGLTSGTVLTLVWVPCAYAILEDFNNKISAIPFLRKFASGNAHVVKV